MVFNIGYDYKDINATTATDGAMIAGAENVIVQIVAKNSANGTIKFAGSLAEENPDFSQPATADNPYAFVQVIDLQDGSSIDGNTGVNITGDGVRLFEVNINALRWLSLNVNVTAGAFDVTIRGYSS